MEIISATKRSSYSLFNCGYPIICGYSKRAQGGFSDGGYKFLNLGLNTGDCSSIVQKNRSMFFDDLGWRSEDVIYVTQTHSALVHNCDTEYFKNGIEGDGLFTTQKNRLITVTTADCGNVILFSESASAISVIHCGWKSVKGGIIANAIKMFREESRGFCGDIIAFMGPMIRGESYEVSEGFQSENFPENGSCFNKINGKTFFHLDRYIKERLTEENVKSIHDCCIDTYAHTESFFSYRRDKNTGRIVTFAALK